MDVLNLLTAVSHMERGGKESASLDGGACSGEPSSTSASSTCSSPFELSRPGRSAFSPKAASSESARRHSLGSSNVSEELDAFSNDLEVPRLRRKVPSVSSINWAGSDVSRFRRSTSLQLSRSMSSSHEGEEGFGKGMFNVDMTPWSQQILAGDKAMEQLHCLTVEEMTVKLEDPADWPISLMEVRNKFWEDSSAMDTGGQRRGFSSRLVSEGVANKMLQYYSFCQQLFLDIVLTSQALAGGLMEAGKALPRNDGCKVGPLQSIAGLVPGMGCLGTLTSYTTAEGLASRKLLLAKRVAALFPASVPAIQSVAEICGRVLAVFREKRLSELENDSYAVAGRKAVHQRLFKDSPLVPSSIESGVKILVVHDIDLMLWPVEVGQLLVQQEGQLGERLVKFCLTQERGRRGSSTQTPPVPFVVRDMHQGGRSRFKMDAILGEEGPSTRIPEPLLSSSGESVSAEEASTIASSASTQSSTFATSVRAGGDSPRSVLGRGGVRRRPEEREVIRSLEVRCNSLEMELAALRMRKSAGGRGGKREEKKGSEVDSKHRSWQMNGLAAMQERSQKVVLEVEEMQRHLKMVRGGLEEAPNNSTSRPVYDDKAGSLMSEKERVHQQLYILHLEQRQLQIDMQRLSMGQTHATSPPST